MGERLRGRSIEGRLERIAGQIFEALESMSRLLEIKLRDFGVDAKVVAVDPGPVITRFEIQPAAGVKVNRISNLVKDLAAAAAAAAVKVE